MDLRRPSALHQFRMDAARWVQPEEVADLSEVTPLVVLKLLFRHPPLRAMAWFRFVSWASYRRVRGVEGHIQRRLLYRYGLELKPAADVGGGLYIAHPVGCTLFANSIGENVTVIAAVTFGTRTDGAWPNIGDNVFIGT